MVLAPPCTSLESGWDPDRRQRVRDPAEDLLVGIADPKDPSRVGALRVEEPGEEASRPFGLRSRRPCDQLPNALGSLPRLISDRGNRPTAAVLLREREPGGRHAEAVEEGLRARQSLAIREREAKPVQSARSPWALVGVATDVAVAADHPGEVPLPVRGRRDRRSRKGADAHELVARGEVGPPEPPPLGAHDVLPAAIGEESVIATGDQLGSVVQRDAEGGLPRDPMSEHLGQDVAAIAANSNGPVDGVADAHLS